MAQLSEKVGFREEFESERRAVLHLLREYQRAQEQRDSASERMAAFADTIRLVLIGLPVEERAPYERRLADLRQSLDARTRGGEAYGKVIALFKSDRRKTWSIPEIQAAIGDGDDPTEQKALYNAIGYLAKSGRLKRIARGQYLVAEAGVGIEFDGIEDGTARRSENDD